jgi:hypothetical protein
MDKPKSRELLSSGSGVAFFGAHAYVSNTPKAVESSTGFGRDGPASKPEGKAQRRVPKPPSRKKSQKGQPGQITAPDEKDDADQATRVAALMSENGVALCQVWGLIQFRKIYIRKQF